MSPFPSRSVYPAASLQACRKTVFLLLLAGILTLATSCSDDYNKRLIAALKELASRPAPYVIHCMEGKDRTGYVCALLEGLCGATYEEMVADYLITYDNYYGVTPQKDRNVCQSLVSLRLNPCLMYYAGVSNEALLPNVDYAKAFSKYLISHGMSQQQLDALIRVLTTPATDKLYHIGYKLL